MKYKTLTIYPPVGPYQNLEEKIEWERKWAETDRLVMEAAAKGEILDAQGKSIPAVLVLQRGFGEYETHHYVMGLFGLEEVEP